MVASQTQFMHHKRDGVTSPESLDPNGFWTYILAFNLIVIRILQEYVYSSQIKYWVW